MFNHLKNFATNYFEKSSAKSKYLTEIKTFLTINKIIWTFQTSCINILNVNKIMYTIKTLIFLFNAVLVNFFLLIISICQIIGKASIVV